MRSMYRYGFQPWKARARDSMQRTTLSRGRRARSERRFVGSEALAWEEEYTGEGV
jgi:hypothetical protein